MTSPPTCLITPGGRLPGEDPGIDLFLSGYSAAHWYDGLFHVLRPATRGGGQYIVDPCAGTCNCIGHAQYGRCKHVRCLCDLVFLTAAELFAAGRYAEEVELLQAWGDVTKPASRQARTAERRKAA